jgi:DNA-binding HxlR family transcriptional regulator
MNLADCPVKATVDVIGSKWKPLILFFLKTGSKRFNELHRQIPEVSQKTLTQHLRELERDGIIARKVYPSVPPKVEYSLTRYGDTLRPILDLMCDWGTRHRLRKDHSPV